MLNSLVSTLAQPINASVGVLSALLLIPSALLHTYHQTQPQGFNQVMSQSEASLGIDSVSLNYQASYSLNQATTAMTRFLGAVPTTAQYPVEVYLLSFEVEVEDGSYSPVQAEVYVPQGVETRLPTIINAPGTTGLDDRCAPTRESLARPRLGNYENQMVAMAAQGFLVVMPNYEGLDNPQRTHGYFIKDNEARSLLGTARALAQITDQLPAFYPQVVIGGYSQGGHAAFAAADLAAELTPEVIIIGLFGHGPTTDTQDLLVNNPNLAPYFAYAYQEWYGRFSFEQMFQADKLFQVERAVQLCVDEAFAFNSANSATTYTPEFRAALVSDTLSTVYPEIDHQISQQDAGTQYRDIPTLILQGTSDPIVTIENQATFAQSLCHRAVPVEMKVYQGINHFQTRQVSFWDTLNWIIRLYRGEAEVGYCF